MYKVWFVVDKSFLFCWLERNEQTNEGKRKKKRKKEERKKERKKKE